MNFIIHEEIDSFRNKYFLISPSYYKMIGKKLGIVDKISWQDSLVCLDYDNAEILFSANGQPSQGITIDNDLSLDPFFHRYRTDDKKLLLACDKISPRVSKLKEIYAIDNVWLAFIYLTKGGNQRLVVNKNLFGTQTTMKSRDFKLTKILEEIESGN